MTSEQKAALINAQTAMMNAEIQGMMAENTWRVHCGNSIAYGEDAFMVVAKKYEPIIGYNEILALYQQQ